MERVRDLLEGETDEDGSLRSDVKYEHAKRRGTLSPPAAQSKDSLAVREVRLSGTLFPCVRVLSVLSATLVLPRHRALAALLTDHFYGFPAAFTCLLSFIGCVLLDGLPILYWRIASTVPGPIWM